MQELILPAQPRTLTAKQLKLLRQQGFVPGIVYGQGKTPTLIQVDAKTLDKVFQQAGTSRLLQVTLANEPTKNVLFHEVQIDPISRKIRHFDLYTVKMDEKIKTEIPLRFTQEAPAVHTYGAVLLKNLETVEVEALPANLPESIEVNLSGLAEIGDALHVKDLQVSKDVTILVAEDELVVKADPPRTEEELEDLEKPLEEGAEASVEATHGEAETPEAEETEAESSSEAADDSDQKNESQ